MSNLEFDSFLSSFVYETESLTYFDFWFDINLFYDFLLKDTFLPENSLIWVWRDYLYVDNFLLWEFEVIENLFILYFEKEADNGVTDWLMTDVALGVAVNSIFKHYFEAYVNILPTWTSTYNVVELISISYLILPGIFLFLVGLFVLAFVRKHILIYLMAIEVMLLGISLILVLFSLYWNSPIGDILVLLILCVAASEVVIALAISVSIYRNEKVNSIAVLDLVYLKN
jgi:NADH-quinone oxidoreductase subunit K